MIISNQRYFTKNKNLLLSSNYYQDNQDNDFDYIYQEFLLIIKNP